MRKIANREAAREWHESEAKKVKHADALESELEVLRYAAIKRKTGYPSVSQLAELGLTESSELLRRAYDLIGQAYRKAREEAGIED